MTRLHRIGLSVAGVLAVVGAAVEGGEQEIVILVCRCLSKYEQWVCEVFWMFLC